MPPIEKKENKMGTMPVNKLLLTMSLPIMISMLVQAMYNVVDSIFVARIGENALTALSLAFPIQNLMISVGAGTCIGVNALLSRSLGEKDYHEANNAAKNGIFLALLSYLVFAVFGLFFSRAFFEAQTENLEIIEYGTRYLSICTIFSLGVFMQITFERILQSTGNTFYNMLTQGLGAIINIILDPILIFGLLGFPKLGVAGSAIATVIGQFAAMFLSIYFNHTRNPEVNLSFRNFRPNPSSIQSIYSVGIPSIIMMSIASVMTYFFNKILLMFSSTAVSVFGVYFRLQSFVFMPVFGLNNGMVPIVAYNYGARSRKRIMDTMKMGIVMSVSIMLIGASIFQLFPTQLLGFFNASPEMLEIGVPALKTISISFIFAGYCIIIGSVFQALGNGVLTLINAVARQLLVILPVAYIFAVNFGLSAVWWAFPIAEISSVTLSTIFLKHTYNKKIKPLDEHPPQSVF